MCEKMPFLTDYQYDEMFIQAHNLCCSCHGKNKIEGYVYLDKLLNYATMITGKYPAPEIIINVWDTARETNGKGDTKDSEMIIEKLIGPFTYDKNRITKSLYDLLVEDLRSVLRENEEFRKQLNTNPEDKNT